MKKKYYLLSFVLFAGLLSCNNQSTIVSSGPLASNVKPVTVSVKSGQIESIESYATDVVIYEGNNRQIGGITETLKYRLSVKEIDGVIHRRIDYPSEMFADGIARSSLTNESELFIFQYAGNDLEYRSELDVADSSDYMNTFKTISRMIINTKIPDFSSLRSQLYDISSDISVDEESSLLQVSLPQEGYKKFTLSFDTENEILLGSQSE